MKPNVPADLTGVPDEELTGLADKIRAAAQDIADSASANDETLQELEGLAADNQRIADEISARDEARAARAERVNAALERIGQPTDSDTDPDSTDDDVDEPATSGDDTDTDVDESGTSAEPAAGVPIAAATETPTTISQQQEEPAVTTTPVPVDAVAQLTAARPAATAPTGTGSTDRRPLAEFKNTGAVYENQRGETVTSRNLAQLITEQARRYARTSSTSGPIILASARVDWQPDEQISAGDHERNFTVMEAASRRAEALVASGANCALLTPNYDVPSWAEAMSPVEDSIPTVGSPRGGVRYVEPPVWPEAYAGVRVTTAAEDAAGYTTQNPPGTTDPKPCVRLDCPPPLECVVDAVSACVELGNLQSNTFPELVEVFTGHLAVAQAQIKEIYYLDGIDAGSTEVNFTGTYGATRSFVHAFAAAAHGMRKRLHMPLDAPLNVFAPDTLVPLIRVDMINDLHLGLGFLNADPMDVARQLFAALRINVTWYYDYSADVGAHGAMQTAQAAGTLNPFPVTYRSWMFPPGTWVRLDGGTLDIGMFRDSTLVETNDFRIFAEEWTQVCKRGGESIALDISVCPNGTGPTSVTALSCTS